jgi:CBS domain-containing protein
MTATTITVPELATGTVGEAMTAGVITCLPETPLWTVARMMSTYRVHAIVVFGHDEDLAPWGVVSDMDLVGALGGRATAGSIAATPVVTTTPDETLLRATQLMREHATAHLLVLATDTRLPIGVISSLDIARAFAAEQGATENFG